MRVNIFLNEKKIKIDRIFLDLSKHKNLDKKYLDINPWGTVPYLITDSGKGIAESMAICRYFDAIQPEPYLFGKEPIEKGLIEMWRRRIESDGLAAVAESFRNSVKAFRNRAFSGPSKIVQIPDLIERGKKRANILLDELNNQLLYKKFVVTDNFTIADIDAYVMCIFAKWVKIDATLNRPSLKKWLENIDKKESIKNLNRE